jgi:hypothetical protein
MAFEFTPARQAHFACFQDAALAKHQELKQQRIEAYYQDPKRCLQCDEPVPYDKKADSSFCSRSCAARYNNSRRTHSPETKEKIASSTKATGPRPNPPRICRVQFKPCLICGRIFCSHGRQSQRKTCSRTCQTVASTSVRPYQNGSRKNIRYNGILLESSWELTVAILLDDLHIKWERPSPMRWIDSNGKQHLYYPDFFLPDHAIYLDPKNPYCMDQQAEKMQIISSMINIQYGPLEDIIAFVKEIGEVGFEPTKSPVSDTGGDDLTPPLADWSGRQNSNLRPPDSRSGALPS